MAWTAEQKRAYNKAYRERLKRDFPERLRAYRLKHRETHLKCTRAWKAANPDRVREHNRAAGARRYQRDRTKVLLRSAIVNMRGRVQRGSAKVPFNSDQLAQKLAYWGDKCYICGTRENLSVDHVKPVKRGGATLLCNLRPCCRSCNSRKGAGWSGCQGVRRDYMGSARNGAMT